MQEIKILHISSHLGGGIGKSILTNISCDSIFGTSVRHDILILEPPVNNHYIDKIRAAKACGEIKHYKDEADIARYINGYDIVQIEFWNSPSLCLFLSEHLIHIKARVLYYIHYNGLFYPKIPIILLRSYNHILYTSSASLELDNFHSTKEGKNYLRDTIQSSFWTIPYRNMVHSMGYETQRSLVYVGTTSTAKLDPFCLDRFEGDFFSLDVIGEIGQADEFKRIVESRYDNRVKLHLKGYLPDPFRRNVKRPMLYLLNPYHYGTGENVLIEAISEGFVPIVYRNNRVEYELVRYGELGITIDIDKTYRVKDLIDEANDRYPIFRECHLSAAADWNERGYLKKWQSAYTNILTSNVRSNVTIFNGLRGEQFYELFNPDFDITAYSSDAIDLIRRLSTLVQITKGSLNHFAEHFTCERSLRDSYNILLKKYNDYLDDVFGR